MNQSEKELTLIRIFAGYTRISINGKSFLIGSPTLEQKYLAEEYYQNSFEQYILNGLFTDTEYLEFLIDKGFWDMNRENSLEGFKKKFEDIKIAIFESSLKSATKAKLKKEIVRLRKEAEKLSAQKNIEIHRSASGLAGIAKLRFLIGTSLLNEDKKPVFHHRNFWDLEDSGILEKAVEQYNKYKIDDADFRELARTEPWRAYWSCRSACNSNIFGGAAINLTDDQKSLIYWTVLYDNVFDHPDCPADDIINDDDALDGFLLSEYRKRQNEKNSKGLGQVADKHGGAQEVFIMAETIEDAKKIEAMNDGMVKAAKQSRDRMIDKKGRVNDLELPDVYQRLKMEATAKIAQDIKKKG